MNINNCLVSRVHPLTTMCAFCNGKGDVEIEAKSLFMYKRKVLCAEHARMWNTGQLNI